MDIDVVSVLKGFTDFQLAFHGSSLGSNFILIVLNYPLSSMY